MSWFNVIVERTGKPYLSYSSIKYALQDMALFELYMKGKLRKESQALTFGSAYDVLLFTPDEFDKRFYVLDDEEIIQEEFASEDDVLAGDLQAMGIEEKEEDCDDNADEFKDSLAATTVGDVPQENTSNGQVEEEIAP